MNKTIHDRVLWIVRTGVLLALLVALQAITKPLGQLVTGSCVNAVLAIAALFSGLGSGIVIAVISPVLAFLLGIAPQPVTVPAIMVGNTVYVVLLSLLADKDGKNIVKQVIAWFAAAAAKLNADLDATDICRSLSLVDTQRAVQLSSLFLARAGRELGKVIYGG